MKKMYFSLVLVFVFLGLFQRLEINAQTPVQEQETLIVPGTEKPVSKNFSDSRSVFVNIIPDTACVFVNETFSFAGLIEAGGFISVQWFTINGFGSFSNENILETEYFPSAFDVFSDGIILYLYVSDGNEAAFDLVVLKVINVSAGESGQICAGQDFQTQASVSEFESLIWTTSGDGIFSDPFALDPNYLPGMNDISSGWVQLTLTATIGSPCNISGSSSLEVYFMPLPVLYLDLEDTEVELGQYVVLSIVADNANGYQWYGPQGLIDGATLPDFEIFETTFDDAGQYYCEFYNDCGSQASSTITLTVYQIQTLSFQTGWSGISSWISPFDTNIENLFQPVVNDLVVLQNYSGIYNPGASINTLGAWDTQTGYQVKFDDPVSLMFKGILNENQSVTLTPGWNYLPVISSCEVDVASVFGSFATVEIIKEIAGWKVFWPELNIASLDTLIPGKAYLIYVNSETTVTFPACTP